MADAKVPSALDRFWSRFSSVVFGRAQALGLLLLVSSYDLFALPANALLFRQTQTALLTESFRASGFRLSGLTLNIVGPVPALLVVEFPLYNAVVGVLFAIFGPHAILGKLVSLTCAGVTLLVLWHIVETLWDESTAKVVAAFFVFSPAAMLVRTAFTPDAMALMFALAGVALLMRWRSRSARDHKSFAFSALAFLAAGVMKFPILVPFIPACAFLVLTSTGTGEGKWRRRAPQVSELLIFAAVFLVPLVGWFRFRENLIYPAWKGFASSSNFLIGDLSRFLSPGYYPQPFLALMAYALCGVGFLLLPAAYRSAKGIWLLLISGVLLTYVLIPTIRHQHHYLYATVPSFAILLGLGWKRIAGGMSTSRRALAPFLMAYAAGFLIASTYLLRHDTTLLRAAEAARLQTTEQDYIVALLLHDRNYLRSEAHPEFFYFAGRKGWNVGYAGLLSASQVDSVVSSLKQQGASKLVVTTYDKSEEPWFATFIPGNLRRDPRYDANSVLRILEGRFPLVERGHQYFIFTL